MLFHAVLAPGNLIMAGVILVLELFLAWTYRKQFAGVLSAKAHPASSSGAEVAGQPATDP